MQTLWSNWTICIPLWKISRISIISRENLLLIISWLGNPLYENGGNKGPSILRISEDRVRITLAYGVLDI